MLFIEEVSRMSKSGYSDMELLEYINEHFDEIERNPSTIVIFALTATW